MQVRQIVKLVITGKTKETIIGSQDSLIRNLNKEVSTCELYSRQQDNYISNQEQIILNKDLHAINSAKISKNEKDILKAKHKKAKKRYFGAVLLQSVLLLFLILA